MPPRILIVGGQERFTAGIADYLSRQGMIALRVADAPIGLARLAADRPDLLLVDLPPSALASFLRALRQAPSGQDLPVVLLGGAERPETGAAAAAFGIRQVLAKPLRGEELLWAVRRVLPPDAPAQPLPQQLRRAFAQRFGGALRFGSGDGGAALWFRHGFPVALHPGFIHRDFADYLRRRSLLSAEEERWFRGEGERSELLVQIGSLPFAQLWQEHRDYLHGELLGAFPAPPAPVREEARLAPPDLLQTAINLPALIHEGYRRHADPGGERRLLELAGGRYLGRTPDFYRLINFLSLNAAEIDLLQRIDGTRTLQECAGERPDLLPLVRTLQLLEMVRLAGAPLESAAAADFPLRPWFNAIGEAPSAGGEEALESFADLVEPSAREDDLPLPPPAATAVPDEGSHLAAKVREARAALDGKNHYEIFGLTRENYSFDRLKENYFRLTRDFGPETLMQLSGAEATMVEEILAAVSAAYNTLSDVVKKERYDELLGSEKIGLGRKGDERFQAQVQFQSGKVFIDMEEWDGAEKALQDACTIEPGNGLYLAHLAWAIYRNPAHAGSLAIREKARQTLHRALALERTAEGFAFKGRMLLDAGQEALAETEFTKAAKLSPRLALARAGLREIEERREQEKKGLLRRLFG